jgi:hypothetical protein
MNVSKQEALHQNPFRTQSKPFHMRTQRETVTQANFRSMVKKSISQRSCRRASDTDVIQITLEKFKQNKVLKQKLWQDRTSENYLMQEYLNAMGESQNASKTRVKAKSPEISTKRLLKEKRILRASLMCNNSVMTNDRRIELMNQKLQSPNISIAALQETKPNAQNSPQSVLRLPSFMMPTTENTPILPIKASISRFQSKNSMSSQVNPIFCKPVTLQNFNDFYKLPVKQTDAQAQSKKKPNYLKVVAVTKKLIKDIRIRKEEQDIRPRSSNLAKDLQLLCESFKPTTSLSRLDIIGSMSGAMNPLQLSKSAFTTRQTNEVNLSSRVKQNYPHGKNKSPFSEYTKKNLKFSTYYQNLDKSTNNSNKKEHTNSVFGLEQQDPSMAQYAHNGNAMSQLIHDRTRTMDLLSEPRILKSQFDIKHASFKMETCPLSILHKYPIGIKLPYVYEYSSQFHYSSYWMDCIMRLCDEKDLESVATFGYYNLGGSASEQTNARFPESLRCVLQMTQKLVADINTEHKIIPNVDNSSIN